MRLYNLIKELSRKHEITLICEKRLHQTSEDIKEVEKICKKVVTVERRKQWSLKNMVKSAFSSHSFLVTGHMQAEMQEKIREELGGTSFDIIHVETFYVMGNLLDARLKTQDVRRTPIVLAEHNIEYQVYQRFVDGAPLFMHPLLSLDVAKIKQEERAAWGDAARVVAVSDSDKAVIEEGGIEAALVANGVNVEEFGLTPLRERSAGHERKILFIGDFKWVQNRDSVEFIIKEIWPLLRERSAGQALKLWIVGRSIPDSIKNLIDDSDVIFDEESSGRLTPEIFQEADILLAPIRVGGGTSYKILESMACGTPVVTMQMSASAIGAKDGEDLMVGQTARELAEKTIVLLQDQKTYEKIATNGRKLIEEKYSWKMIAMELEKVYLSLIH